MQILLYIADNSMRQRQVISTMDRSFEILVTIGTNNYHVLFLKHLEEFIYKKYEHH